MALAGHRHFEVTLATGERLRARNVVSATGLSGLAYTPDVLRALRASSPATLSTCTRSRASPARRSRSWAPAPRRSRPPRSFTRPAAARSCSCARRRPTFNTHPPRDRPLLDRILNPDTVLGASRKNWLLQTLPYGVYFIPERRRVRLVNNYLPPTAPWWIRDRFEGKVAVHVRTTVVGATPEGGRVRLRLRQEGAPERTVVVDHVIAGTGYVLDVDRLAYLDERLRRELRRTEKAPTLSMWFESTRPGLSPWPLSAMSFGPVFRFVAGADVAAPAVARRLAATARGAERVHGTVLGVPASYRAFAGSVRTVPVVGVDPRPRVRRRRTRASTGR